MADKNLNSKEQSEILMESLLESSLETQGLLADLYPWIVLGAVSVTVMVGMLVWREFLFGMKSKGEI